MSKKSDYQLGKKPIYTVLYIVVMALLIGCLVFFVYRARQRKAEFEEKVAEVSSYETEYVIDRRAPETDESETEPSETEAQTEPRAEKETESDRSASDTISDGTKQPGVAG